eukprot:gnl/Chilomastix_caulleri/9027.p1 GENE.gnl/Chilomastix_caulleri/9027~~gnl/Chilomastix_caulleri/9027.p1  ORF type:complete len:91 (+),score=37.64 gnl/Chilomastix_caulleri/9027:115-387(+)
MNELKEDNEDNYKTRFSAFLRHGITPEKVEAMYLNAHIKIRENPNVKKPETEKKEAHKCKPQKKKLALSQRKENLNRRKIALIKEKMKGQ